MKKSDVKLLFRPLTVIIKGRMPLIYQKYGRNNLNIGNWIVKIILESLRSDILHVISGHGFDNTVLDVQETVPKNSLPRDELSKPECQFPINQTSSWSAPVSIDTKARVYSIYPQAVCVFYSYFVSGRSTIKCRFILNPSSF